MCMRSAPQKKRRKRLASTKPWRMDGRRWEAKRFTAIYKALLSPLGGTEKAAEADKVLARTAASLSVRLELLTASMCRGGELPEEYGSIADRCGRAIKRLRTKAETHNQREADPVRSHIEKTYGARA